MTRPQESKLRWHGCTGRIEEGWLREALDGMERPMAYVVGLPGMAQEIVGLLRNRMGF